MHREPQTDSTSGVILATRVSEGERDRLARLARLADRTPSREVRRAIRFYLAHPEEADQYLRSHATQESEK